MSRFLRPFGALLGAAAVLLFFSEYYFSNEEPVTALTEATTFSAWASTLGGIYLFYIFFTIPMIAVLTWTRNPAPSVLFLSGCLFGWVTEGSVIAVVYEAAPGSFFWPSVAWHALVDVMLGLWLIPAALAARRWWVAPVVMVALGVAWAYWTSWRWVDEVLPPETFNETVWRATPLFFIGTALLAYLRGGLFTLTAWIGVPVSLLALGLAGIMGAAAPLQALGLALLVALTGAALWWARRTGAALPSFAAPPSPWRLLWMALTPICAIFTYEAMLATGVGISLGVAAMVLFSTSILLMSGALWRCFSGAAAAKS